MPGLLRQLHALGCGGDSDARCPLADFGPRLEHEGLREPGEPPVRAVAGGSGPEERERQAVSPHGGRGLPDVELPFRVGDVERSHQPHASHDLRALTHRVEERQRGQPRGVVRRGRELFGDLCDVSPRLAIQVLPVSTNGDRDERLERLVVMARLGELLRDGGEAPDRGRTGPRRLEHLDVEGGERALLRRKAASCCAALISRAVSVARPSSNASSPARNSRMCKRGLVHGELRRPFERRQRDLATAAKPCSLGGRVQGLRDLLVRPGCCGGPVPDGAVGLVAEGPRELQRALAGAPPELPPAPPPTGSGDAGTGTCRGRRCPNPAATAGAQARVARRLGKLAVRQRREQE